ncbi:16927_t:CDS:2 [Dentiscutata heterogama]|uniref:16927_t:CDS:1 n=1 Tax=Dentiscutata heterogama TaxID=1316150 RepID=A0ACA9NIX7_9GLOM|nr:16927_t:CDS:2 [Dentiscutata heterogama]
MVTTTRAKHRQLEKQQSVLLTDDDRLKDNFQDIYNSDKETLQESNLNKSFEPLLPAKRKKRTRTSTKPKSSFVWKFFSQPIDGKVSSLNKQPADELKKSPRSQGQLTLHQSLENTKPHSKLHAQKLNNDFIKYSHDLDPKYNLPCKPVLKDKIDEVYDDDIIEIQQKISKINYVSMTLDLWSSAAHISYLEVILHWTTCDFIPCKIFLAIKEIPYPYTATVIKEEGEKLINKFQLESKLYAIVTDNGSNIKLAINQLRIRTHIPCSAHTLQLTQNKKQQLKEAQLDLINQQENNNNKLDDDEEYIILNIVKANNTRWNSIYYAFERLIILKSAIIILKENLLQDISSRIRHEEEILEELIPSIYK